MTFLQIVTGADGDHWIQSSWSLCVNNAEVMRDPAIRVYGMALIPTVTAGDARYWGRAVLQDYRTPPLAFYAIYPPT
ncbi:hypothetical protein AC629_35250 [Bradyrhizobium sp. NAS80.1]|nr:hypothetical protein AC629_35250 [Bradyrhizobium sp. NAS80.1]